MLDGIAMLLNGVGDLVFSESAGGNVFVGYMPTSPDRAVAVYSRTGDEPDSKLPYDQTPFQIIVRGEQDGVWARATWSAVYSKVHGKRNLTLPDGTYLVFALAESASPLPLGPDENDRARLVGDFTAEIINTTEERIG